MKKYWQQYAEIETQLVDGFPTNNSYEHVICIPAYDEKPDFILQLKNLSKQEKLKVLLILVVNQPNTDTRCDINNVLLQALKKGNLDWQKENLALTNVRSGFLDILYIDRFSPNKRIPFKQGVGLARKIGCDIAAKLIEMEVIKDDKIFSSDADVIFPKDYFEIKLPDLSSAGVFPFKHVLHNNNEIYSATQLYEKSLQHYVDGLNFANCRYAYHSIGSSLVIKAKDYIKVRGFPKRSGAEDFYILNKLNKIKPVISLKSPILLIKARSSNRVPFGTGPATAKIMNKEKLPSEFFYAQDAYELLKIWLIYLDYLCDNPKENSLETFLSSHHLTHEKKTIRSLQDMMKVFKLDMTFWAIAKNHSSSKQRKKAIHDWFDGFKTLKMIRLMSDSSTTPQ